MGFHFPIFLLFDVQTMKKLEEFPDLKIGDIIRVEYDGNIWYELILSNIEKYDNSVILYTFNSYSFFSGTTCVSTFKTSDTQKIPICELFKD